MSKFIAGIALESRRISCVIAEKNEISNKDRKTTVSIRAVAGQSMLNDVVLMNNGWPADMILITQLIKNIIAETEEKANKLQNKDGKPLFDDIVRAQEIYISVHGSRFSLIEGRIEKNFDAPEYITEERISSLLEESLSETAFSEAEKGNVLPVIHVIPQKFYAKDSAPITSPLGMSLSSINCNYIAVAASEDALNNINNAVSNNGETDINGTFYEPVVAGEYMLTGLERATGSIFLDIGRLTSTMAIYKDGALVFFKELEAGGDTVSFNIQTYLNRNQNPGNEFSLSAADEIKMKHGAANPKFANKNGGELIKTDKKQITEKELIDKCLLPHINLVLDTFEKFFKDFLKRKNYKQSVFSQVILTGGGANLKGMPDLVKQFFKAKSVRQASIPPKVFSGIKAKLECPEDLQKMDYIAPLATINYAFNKPSQNDLYSWNEDTSMPGFSFYENTIGKLGDAFRKLFGRKSSKN